MTGSTTTRDRLYELLTGDDEGRICKDIPDSACNQQPGNFLRHVVCLGATKAGDGLSDPKVVLAWLLAGLGAPAWSLGLLVPIREAGALIPQLFVAGAIRRRPVRKWLWTGGSLVQGLAVAGMAVSALTLQGVAAGSAIVSLLLLFSLARSVCSVSYKDVLGKTVARASRGTATGTATTLGAAVVLVYGVLLATGAVERSVTTVSAAMLLAAGLWCAAALLFTGLTEEPGSTEGGGNAWTTAIAQAGLLREDPQLVRFIAVRGLLVALALAPPYLLALASREGGGFPGDLGFLVLASAGAGLASSYAWGRLSDRSSRQVLMRAALLGSGTLVAAAATSVLGPGLLSHPALLPGFVFLVMISYQGVRIGRSTHIVDMADEKTRAAYTALSNTAIGLFLALTGALGWIAQSAGESVLLFGLAGMATCGGWLARGLREVQA